MTCIYWRGDGYELHIVCKLFALAWLGLVGDQMCHFTTHRAPATRGRCTQITVHTCVTKKMLEKGTFFTQEGTLSVWRVIKGVKTSIFGRKGYTGTFEFCLLSCKNGTTFLSIFSSQFICECQCSFLTKTSTNTITLVYNLIYVDRLWVYVNMLGAGGDFHQLVKTC